jgi:hypothetical protein
MPSTGETRWFIGASVGVCVAVGKIVSIVEVEIAVGGGFVGTEVAVGWMTGTSVVAQAVRKNKEAIMNFFMVLLKPPSPAAMANRYQRRGRRWEHD